jgi:hypothetical protein
VRDAQNSLAEAFVHLRQGTSEPWWGHRRGVGGGIPRVYHHSARPLHSHCNKRSGPRTRHLGHPPVAVGLAQWCSVQLVRAVAMCWCQDDIEGYAGAGLRSLDSCSDPPPSYGGENALGQGKHAVCMLGLEAEVYAGGAALARRRVCGAWCGRLQQVCRRPLAHRRCPAGSLCDREDERSHPQSRGAEETCR